MLDRIEKKIGKYAIKNLIYYVLGGYVIGYILLLLDTRLGLYEYITLSPALVMKGQVWRLFTWVCTIPQNVSIFLIFMFLLYLYIGKSLEQHLGAFKYNLYMFSGWFFTTLGAMAFYWITKAINGPAGAISMNVSTYYLNLASFLAFAVLFPEVRVLFFGILPIKIKWLAIIDVAYLGMNIIVGVVELIGFPSSMFQSTLSILGYSADLAKLSIITEIYSILISLLNFIIFYIATRDFRKLSLAEARRKREFRENMQSGYNQNPNNRQTTYTPQSDDTPEENNNPKKGQAWFGPNGYYNSDSDSSSNQSQNPNGFSEQPQKKRFGYGADNAKYSEGSSIRTEMPKERPVPQYRANGDTLMHTCTICGRTNLTNPELTFRYCSKCEGNHEYCQDHLFTHEHVK